MSSDDSKYNLQLPKNLKVSNHLTPAHIDQLIQFSNRDQAILSFTSDKARFANFDKVSEWLSGSPSLHVLTNADEADLLGLIWFRPKLLDWPAPFDVHSNSLSITLAKRTYPPARGEGRVVPFFREAIQQYLGSSGHEPSVGFWLSTRTRNITNIAVNRKLGFKVVGGHLDDTFMSATASDITNALQIPS